MKFYFFLFGLTISLHPHQGVELLKKNDVMLEKLTLWLLEEKDKTSYRHSMISLIVDFYYITTSIMNSHLKGLR